MPTTIGIMGHSVSTLKLVLKSLLSTEPWLRDPNTLPIPWRGEKEYDAEKESGQKPAFGFMFNDGVVSPHPPISRALGIIRKALEDSGYQVCAESKLPVAPKVGAVSDSASSFSTGCRRQTTSLLKYMRVNHLSSLVDGADYVFNRAQ
jgi:Asp-tRNA(Asn)/Glu-tRNA(Gln) amidotransferase A subunit family amidase